MNGLLQCRELALVFRLWDPQGHGRVNRAAVAAVLEYFYRQGQHLISLNLGLRHTLVVVSYFKHLKVMS